MTKYTNATTTLWSSLRSSTGAILGIAVSIGPSIYHVLRPLREYLKRFLRWFTIEILIPTVIRCHNWGLIEVVAWTFVAGLMIDAEKLFAMETGCFIAATSLALSVPCFFYSTMIWTKQVRKSASRGKRPSR